MVRANIAAGYDGIFFDNPTVHPDGCYCPHCMEEFDGDNLVPAKVLLVESASVFKPEEAATSREFERRGEKLIAGDEERWTGRLIAALGAPSLSVTGPATVRAYVHDQPGRTIVHVLNLNIRRLSSFEDAVTPAGHLHARVRVPFERVRSVTCASADVGSATGRLSFRANQTGKAVGSSSRSTVSTSRRSSRSGAE